MEAIIKEQNVEILNFKDFEKEIRNSHLEYLKSQISSSDFERLQKAIKDNDVVECSAIVKSWHIDLNDISSGMFRKHIAFKKNEDGSYFLYDNGWNIKFSSNQVLLILENGIVTPVSLYQKDFFIGKYKQ